MPEPETTPPAAGEICGCCTFGNHTEPCTCDGSNCCHPEKHRPAVPVPGLRDQIAGVLARTDGICGTDHGFTDDCIDLEPDTIIDAVLAVVQPVINKAQQRAEAMERAMEDTAADALKHRGCHRSLMGQVQRAETAEAALARVRDLHDRLTASDGLTDPEDAITRAAAARRIAAALDGYTPPVPADQPEGGTS